MTNNLSGFPVASDAAALPTQGSGVVPDVAGTASGSVLPSPPTVGNQSSANQVVGSMAKEQMEVVPTIDANERVPLVEVKEEEAIPEEVSSWIEKLEKGEDIHLPQPVVHDDQVLVQSPTPQFTDDMIILPMTEEEVQKGLHEQVFTGARWLAEWCVRIMKKFHGHVMYRAGQAGGMHGPN